MTDAFEVVPYSIGSLKDILARKAGTPAHVIDAKLHSHYFRDYFAELDARTIVVENDYVDHDFLEDFASYYVRCFGNYRRTCTRLHFFNATFGKRQLNALLRGSRSRGRLDQGKLQDAYLGFIIVKPLPQTIIGRTCLKTYDDHGGLRQFPVVRRYDANLFGIPLWVDTLAFQEQDRVVAACATSALWTIFQGTGMQFQHPIPSPAEITRVANTDVPLETRTFPSQGLTIPQMAHAIATVGLEPFLVQVRDDYVLKGTLYAYLRGSIPVLMGIDLYGISGPAPQFEARHAVAVTGFRLGPPVVKKHQKVAFLLKASGLDRIYVHDDQVGPFARMAFDKSFRDKAGVERASISTSLPLSGGGAMRAAPDIIMVPLYKMIRIPFGVVHDTVVSFNGFIERLRSNTRIPLGLMQQLEWDIYLTTINDFKEEIRATSELAGDLRRDVLLQRMPRFLWRATATSTGAKVLDLIFDTTDIEQGAFFVRAVEYDAATSVFLREVCRTPGLDIVFGTDLAWKILEWFKAQSA